MKLKKMMISEVGMNQVKYGIECECQWRLILTLV